MHECVPNLGPRQQRRRLIFGVVSLAAAAALAVAFASVGVSGLVRALLALPLYGAALGFFQFREKT